MFSPAGVVAYAYGPQATGCVPYWMVAETASSSPSRGRSPLTGGQVPYSVPPESPTRVPTGANPSYPASAAAYHDLLKRTVQLNDLLYPSVVPLPGTLTTDNTSPTSAARHSQQSLRHKQDTLRTAQDPSPYRASQDRRSPGVSPLHGHGHPLSPTVVHSKDLKFGIDRILHPSRKSEDSSKDELQKRENPESSNSMIVRRPIAKNPTHRSPVLNPPRPTYCPPGNGVYGSPESGIGGDLSPTKNCHRTGVMGPHSSHVALSQHGHQAHQLTAAAAGYRHHFRHEYLGHLSMMGHNAHQIQASQQHHQEQSHPKRKRSWSRAVFSHLQRKGLEKRFEVQKYVTKPDRRQLAAMLGLTDAQVKVWFQNRRMKWRHAEEAKRKKEEEDKRIRPQNSSNVSKTTEPNITSHNTSSEICMKSDDENDSEDERDHFEYSFENGGHHDELIVDGVSSDEEDDGHNEDLNNSLYDSTKQESE